MPTTAQQCPYAPQEAETYGQEGQADRGAPELDFGRTTPYVDYAGVNTLLDLKRPLTKEPAESAFILTTQVMELLFTLVAEHWTAARDALEEDDVHGALAWLRRSRNAQDVLTSSWDMLADMTPTQFNRFRDAFGEASGFQSYTYRHLEFLLGNKSAPMMRPHKGMPQVAAQLDTALRQPGLYDAALRLLARRGLPVPESAVERDWTEPYEEDPAVTEAWAHVYADERDDNDLLLLAETLMDVAERVTRWRHRHLMAVKRTMGGKPGSGGSNGLDWLARNAEKDVFPELWRLRDTL